MNVLRIIHKPWTHAWCPRASHRHEDSAYWQNYGIMLSNLAVAQSNLIRSGDPLVMKRINAIMQEIQDIYGFSFEIIEE